MQIVLIAGSNRSEATSTKLVRYMAAQLEVKGHEAIVIDLYQSQLPLYCPDSNEDNANVIRLKESVSSADAIVLATPEYHGSISGVLKNALDYLSFEHVNNKVVLSVSSAGGAVGVSSLTHLQTMVRNLHGINCPEWVSIGGDLRQFTEEGKPQHANVIQRVNNTLDYFLKLAEQTRPLT
ncbi:NADPH-dependent FMN reductase [Paenibacillus apiarius]|uniref:NAD(P)H-dependent oxidoreductase n=1 Tax=Paenibacillus apiarius TaxID=46240 RepID=A0ABT4DZY3_9BACL|nr:NADPH-dependent FMN reductase [Paenibacillus apiarius]MBN3522805.1 NAD(P)H-dependent oxidoreductase [Paenibacillus apiarius]MCY9515102.1 NAD(P)H-dependent oxidoreductase [Paenibacillus apiarius]MCY9522912.1 NAD(P)H-dependent oxidoreductase [Paenibacillus apiarius]MCY9553715.1 NAD(P)H-dependent oxidoreductase [Paenibacillus apiarius]MCY9556452.1 NAD(P)H-dependent oxidoreductase [Paenibacillus apiarius]